MKSGVETKLEKSDMIEKIREFVKDKGKKEG
jgi:predicted RNase H-related nuclease YkuK (DUF458 family)